MIPKPGAMLRSARAEMRLTVPSTIMPLGVPSGVPLHARPAAPPSAHGHRLLAGVATLLGVSLVMASTFVATGCENNAIGRPCDLESAGDNSASQNSSALECPSRICVKPSLNPNVASSPNLPGALCTADCSKDSDCNDGEIRDPKNPNDHRCQNGWACAVPVTSGDLCCKRLCVCKDFLVVPNTSNTADDLKAAVATPAECDPSVAVNLKNCKNLGQ